MNPVTAEIKFFDANINHERYGEKKHFFKNRTNAILIDLKTKPQKKILKYPSLFSLEKFNLLTWSASKHGNQSKFSTSHDLYQFIKNLCINKSKDKEVIHKIKLLTFPKVLDFGFNPLSVYFCYNNKGLLIHSIFEVRNTFGDMHHYVLRNINLKNKPQQKKILKYPSLFSLKKFNLLTWSASKHGNQSKFSTSHDLYQFIKNLCNNRSKNKVGYITINKTLEQVGNTFSYPFHRWKSDF